MASEADMSESSMRNLSVILPFIMGIATAQDTDREPGNRTRDRTLLINPVTQNVIVIDGIVNLNALWNKDGRPPASKASIDAMPTVEISEKGECAICLEEYEAGERAREMPCKHRFHSGCIEKWLGINGSCPVCRFKMPVDDEEEEKKGGDGGGGGEDGEGWERRGERDIRVSVWVTTSGWRGSDSSSDRAGESGDSNTNSRPRDENENAEEMDWTAVGAGGSSAEDMDWTSEST